LTPSEQIGHEAAVMLERMMRGRKPPKKPVFVEPTGIVERRSTDSFAISDPDVAQALLFIRDHAFKAMRVSDILKEVPISRRSIERKFTEILGRTPAEEIRRLRNAK